MSFQSTSAKRENVLYWFQCLDCDLYICSLPKQPLKCTRCGRTGITVGTHEKIPSVDELRKAFAKRFLTLDGVQETIDRLERNGVNRDRLMEGLMWTPALMEFSSETARKAGAHEKAKRRQLRVLSPCLLDAAQRLEVADLYFSLSSHGDVRGVVKTLRAFAATFDDLLKQNLLLYASLGRGRQGTQTRASIRDRFIAAIRPTPTPQHFNADIETLLHALKEMTGVDVSVSQSALKKYHTRREPRPRRA